MTYRIPTIECMSHHFCRRSIDIVSDHFDDYAIKKQDFMETDEQIEKVIALIPDKGTHSSYRLIVTISKLKLKQFQ